MSNKSFITIDDFATITSKFRKCIKDRVFWESKKEERDFIVNNLGTLYCSVRFSDGRNLDESENTIVRRMFWATMDEYTATEKKFSVDNER